MQTEKRTAHLREEVSDSLLAERMQAGDEDAFAVLVRRYRPWLFSFICRLTHNGSEAEDIVQHVFLKLYLTLPTLRTDQPLEPWLFQVAHNRCVDEARRKHPWSFSELEEGRGMSEVSELSLLLDPRPLPEEIVEQQEMQSIVQQAVNSLPAKFRTIVQLRYAGQLSFAEIAQVLGIPEPTAKTYMHRAKPLLRRALHAQQQVHGESVLSRRGNIV